MKLSTETRHARDVGLYLYEADVSSEKATTMELENMMTKVLTTFYGGRCS